MLNDFVLTGFAFWCLFGFVPIAYFTSWLFDTPFPFVVGTIGLGLLVFFGDWGTNIQSIFDNWQLVISLFIAYVLIGGMYSIFKWWLFLNEPTQKSRMKTLYKQYVARIGETATIDGFKNDYMNDLIPSKYKSSIVSWIVFWPFSGIWTLTHDLVEHIYNSLLSVYTKIANSRISKTLGE